MLSRTFEALVERKVKVYIITRDPNDHDISMQRQAIEEIRRFETMGVQVILNTNYNHRKIAILDRKVLWEGSLNILSQTYSCEIMRRIDSNKLSDEMFTFLELEKFVY